jgi:predicted component of type VI protein secretion system
MPNAIIHFGAPVKGKKAVPVEVRNLGLTLLPSAPSQVVVDVANQYSQANFSVYKHALSLFVVAASEKKTVSLNESIYQQINHTHVPDFLRVPKLIWSYNYALSPDQKNEIKIKFEATETETQGKVAFTRVWKDQTWWNLLKAEGSINRHTATNSTNMNIAGFVHFMIISRIIDQFMRINQYSSYKDNKDDGSIKGQTLMTDTDIKAEEDVDVAGSSTIQVNINFLGPNLN